MNAAPAATVKIDLSIDGRCRYYSTAKVRQSRTCGVVTLYGTGRDLARPPGLADEVSGGGGVSSGRWWAEPRSVTGLDRRRRQDRGGGVSIRQWCAGPDHIARLRARVDAGDEVAMYGLARLLAERGDAAAIAELRARAEAGDRDAAWHLAEKLAEQLAQRGDAAAIAELQALANACHRGAARRLIRLLARRMRQGDKTAAAELRALTEAGDRDAAGRLGEELAGQGDPEGALQVWARAYGDDSPTTKRLAELHAEEGDLDEAVSVWRFSDAVHQNPAGTHEEYLDTMDDTARMEMGDETEDWAFMESEKLARLLAKRAERGDEAAWEELRARADGWAGGPAGKQLARLLAERGDEPSE